MTKFPLRTIDKAFLHYASTNGEISARSVDYLILKTAYGIYCINELTKFLKFIHQLLTRFYPILFHQHLMVTCFPFFFNPRVKLLELLRRLNSTTNALHQMMEPSPAMPFSSVIYF